MLRAGKSAAVRPTYFGSGDEFRAWLGAHHDRATELVVGLYKKGTRRAAMTYQDALDAALAYGWIDGVRRSVDAERWTIRFTPRKPRSIWSNVNIKRMGELIALGRVEPAGLHAFKARDPKRSGVYTYEQVAATFDAATSTILAGNKRAKTFFDAQPPGYKKLIVRWVMSAKKDETRQRRLARLIAVSAKQQRIDFMKPSP